MPESHYRIGGLYGLGQPPESIRFVKVLETGPSHVWIRAFAEPPKLEWDLGSDFPTLQIGTADAEDDDIGVRVVRVATAELDGWIPHFWASSGIDSDEIYARDREVLKEVPVIDRELAGQLMHVEPSRDRELTYRPCRIRLRDGSVLDRVAIVEAEPYIQKWGSWPQHEEGRRYVSIAEVVQIEETACRLPARVATKLYEAGESRMGAFLFTLVLRDGRHINGSSGSCVDFTDLPDGVAPREIVDVIAHEQADLAAGGAGCPDFSWCLYRAER